MGKPERVSSTALIDVPFEVRPIGVTIGAEIRGLDLAQPPAESVFAALYAALIEHKVVFFRNQRLTPEQHVAFGRLFGELEINPFRPERAALPEMMVLDNHEGNPVLSTDIWHSDTTFRECPTKFSILRCLRIPARGGDTLWADMAAAYEGLSARVKNFIAGLEAIHDFKNFRLLYGDDEAGRERLREMERTYPKRRHPVVRTHPDTGERALYVNPQFTLRIADMSARESDAILGLLFEQAKTPEYQFRLHWEPDTVAMWDNRSTQHYASNDYYPARRHMERVAVIGDPPYFDPEAKPAGAHRTVARVHAYEGLH